MPSILLAGEVTSAPQNLRPPGSKPPLVSFNMRADGDTVRVWKIFADDGAELGMDRVARGDRLAIIGSLAVDVEKGRIAYKIRAEQVLFLRNKSIAKSISHEHYNGFARPRVD